MRLTLLFIAMSICLPAVSQSQFTTAEQMEGQAKAKRHEDEAARFQLPIGKTYWIDPRPATPQSMRKAFYKDARMEAKFGTKLLEFSGAFYANEPLSFVPVEYIDYGWTSFYSPSGPHSHMNTYRVRFNDGTEAYVEEYRFGLADPALKEYEPASGLLELLYTESPVILKQRYEARVAAEDEANRLKNSQERERNRAIALKKGGVRIGMSAAKVRASNWGEPLTVNRTVTAHGTSEQWVYKANSYLYFRNGVLVTIQN